MIEREVDGLVGYEEVWNAEDAAQKAHDEIGGPATWATWLLAELSREATSSQTDAIVEAAVDAHALAQIGDRDPQSSVWIAAVKAERSQQAALLRDLFGNPFRSVDLVPALRTATVTALAQAADEKRALPEGELDSARLAVLADALEEAGCTEQVILDHLRSPGPHFRGCWPLDLVLAKE